MLPLIRNFFFLCSGFLLSSGLLAVGLFFWLFFCCFLWLQVFWFWFDFCSFLFFCFRRLGNCFLVMLFFLCCNILVFF
jgi:hypothetical protein